MQGRSKGHGSAARAPHPAVPAHWTNALTVIKAATLSWFREINYIAMGNRYYSLHERKLSQTVSGLG